MVVFAVLSTGALCGANGPRRLFITHEHTDEYRRDVLPPCLASPLLLCYHIIDGEPGGLSACLTSIWLEERGWDFKPFKKYAGLFLEHFFMKVAGMLVDPPPNVEHNFIRLTLSLLRRSPSLPYP